MIKSPPILSHAKTLLNNNHEDITVSKKSDLILRQYSKSIASPSPENKHHKRGSKFTTAKNTILEEKDEDNILIPIQMQSSKKNIALNAEEEKLLNQYLKFNYYIKEEKIKNQEFINEEKKERIIEYSDDEEKLVNKIKEMDKKQIDTNPVYFLNMKDLRPKNIKKKKKKKKKLVLLQDMIVQPKTIQILGRDENFYDNLPETQSHIDTIINSKNKKLK
jgi:hypothetical protein